MLTKECKLYLKGRLEEGRSTLDAKVIFVHLLTPQRKDSAGGGRNLLYSRSYFSEPGVQTGVMIGAEGRVLSSTFSFGNSY